MPPPQTLVDAVKARRLVPFVGAGLSLSVGRGVFPDWKDLIERLADRLDREALAADAAAVRAHLAANQFTEAAELAFEKLTPSRFGPALQSIFDRRPPHDADLSAVAALWRLRPPVVMTTNYDTVLRWPFWPRPGRVYEPTGDPPRIAHNDDQDLLRSLDGAAGSQRPLIWHLHGSVDRPKTMILTRRQYERLYAAGSDQAKEYAFALDQLRSVIANRTLLFVGFSLDDPFVSAQLDYILDVTSKQNAVNFLLLLKGEKDPSDILQRYQAQIIEFDAFGPPMVRTIGEIADAAWGPGSTGASIPAALTGLVDNLTGALRRAAPDPAIVGRAFNRWKPQGWTPFPLGGDGVALAAAAVDKLAGAMRQAGGYFPLIELAREVAGRSTGDHRQALNTWIDAAADALGADAEDAGRLKAGGFPAPHGFAADENYVLVRLDEAGAEHWRVQAWLFSGGEPEKLFRDEWELPRSDLPDVVYELLDRVAALNLTHEQTTVAFMAPRALLVEALDQVQPAVEFVPEPPIGVTLPVTVRPLERLKYPKNLRQLGVTWQTLKAAAKTAVSLDDAVPPGQAGAAVWLSPRDAGPDLAKRLQDHGITCAVLASPPPARPTDPTSDLYNCVLQAAVPAVVWLREPGAADAAVARDRVKELLGEAAAALPHRVWQRRQAARDLNDPAHPGCCLVLLWDDADRLPPDRVTRAAVPRA